MSGDAGTWRDTYRSIEVDDLKAGMIVYDTPDLFDMLDEFNGPPDIGKIDTAYVVIQCKDGLYTVAVRDCHELPEKGGNFVTVALMKPPSDAAYYPTQREAILAAIEIERDYHQRRLERLAVFEKAYTERPVSE